MKTERYKDGAGWRVRHSKFGVSIDHPGAEGCEQCDAEREAEIQGPRGPIKVNPDMNLTPLSGDPIEDGAREFATRVKAMTPEQREVKLSGGPEAAKWIADFLQHSNLQAVIDHIVGLVETLETDTAKAVTDLSNRLSPTVDEKVEGLRQAMESALKRVEAQAKVNTDSLSLGSIANSESIQILMRNVETLENLFRGNVAESVRESAGFPDVLNELAIIRGKVDEFERRLTASNEMGERERRDLKAEAVKMRKDHESMKSRVSNRIGQIMRTLQGDARFNSRDPRAWTPGMYATAKGVGAPVLHVTIDTTCEDGDIHHHVNGQSLIKHSAIKHAIDGCGWCAANEKGATW